MVTGSGRPSVTLSSDGPPSDYKVQGHDCLDEGSTLDQGCWDQLNLNAWLPAWVKFSDSVSSQTTKQISLALNHQAVSPKLCVRRGPDSTICTSTQRND